MGKTFAWLIENNFRSNLLAGFYSENSQYKTIVPVPSPPDRFTNKTSMAEGKQKQASQQSFNISNVILVIYGQKKNERHYL